MADISRYRGGASKRKPSSKGKQVLEGAGSRIARERQASLRNNTQEERPERNSAIVLTESGAEELPRIRLPYQEDEENARRVRERAEEESKDGFTASGRGVRYRRRF